ncbi:MAG: SLC13 family permease [Solitalea-like symbiont of Acarus siro]
MFFTPINLSVGKFLLCWSDTNKRPWGILLLFGVGLCLAHALELTKVIEMLIHRIPLTTISFSALLVIFIVCTMFTTEVMSNVTASLIYLPIAFVIVKQLNLNPLYFTIPIVISSSCAFWFPIGTPPNAIVFSSNMITIKHMVKSGICLSIVAIILIFILAHTLLPIVFN